MSDLPHGHPLPLHVLLLPSMPVLALWAGNASEVRGATPLILIGAMSVFALVLAAIITLVQRDVRRSALIATFVMFVFGSYSRLTGDVLHPRIGLGLVVAMTLLWILGSVRLGEQPIRTVTTILNVIGLALVAANGVVVLTNRPSETLVPKTSVPEGVAPAQDQPDVWYIAPDRYPDLTLLEAWDIDTNGIKEKLERRGFEVAEQAWANYPATQVSLASAWDAAPLDVPEGSDPTSYAVELLEDPRLGRMFRAAGYEYLHLGTWLDDTASSASATRVLTLQGAGEFYDAFDQSSLLPTVRAAFDLPARTFTDIRARQLAHARHQLRTLRELAAAPSGPQPRFVLTHITLPHPPYVFDAEGAERTTAAATSDSRAAYTDQLAFFNEQLLEIIDVAQARSDPPLIVIMADEGVYPEDISSLGKSDYDLRDLSPLQVRQRLSIVAAVFDPRGEVALTGNPVTPLTVIDGVLRRTLGVGAEDPGAPVRSWAPNGSRDLFVDVTRMVIGGTDRSE